LSDVLHSQDIEALVFQKASLVQVTTWLD